MISTDHTTEFGSPIRQVKGKAEVFSASAASANGSYVKFENVVAGEKAKVIVSSGDDTLETTEIKVYGKNLFDASKLLKYKWSVDENGVYSGGSGTLHYYFNRTSGIPYMTFESVGRLTLSFWGYFAEGQKPNGLYFQFKYEDGTVENFSVKSTKDTYYTYTTKANAKPVSLHFSYGNAGDMHYLRNIQIEEGTTATAYEPYKEPKTYTATIGEEIEVEPYAPTTVIIPKDGVYIEKAECVVCACANTFAYNDSLQSIEIERAGDNSKFFGFGVSHKLTLKLRDKDRAINIEKGDYFKVYFGADEESYISAFPPLFVDECKRDENNNNLTITAFCALQEAGKITVGELELSPPYTLADLTKVAANAMGLAGSWYDETNEAFSLDFPDGANLEGTETLAELLADIAEATQTIYFINRDNVLVFKRLSAGAADLTIGKAEYFTLSSETAKTLGGITSTNELGDSVSVGSEENGVVQYVRDNAFWELRDDVATLLENAFSAVGGLTSTPFSCKWRGNYYLEIGDGLALITKDNNSIYTWLLDDKLTYNGGFVQSTQWKYEESGAESSSNPAKLGEVLKQTFAKVDKANKKIELLASETSANTTAISSLQVTTQGITGSVSNLEERVNETSGNIETLNQKVSAQITPDQVTLAIQEEMSNGVDKVTTSTGFSFDENGLTVSKSDSEIETQITEDGMNIKKSGEEVLTANNEGVTAVDLRAKTYLVVGDNSRLEDYGTDRTACFWIGGN